MGICFGSLCAPKRRPHHAVTSHGRSSRRARRGAAGQNGHHPGHSNLEDSPAQPQLITRRSSIETDARSITTCPSLFSDGDDFFSCRDEFSVTDGAALSVTESPPGSPKRPSASGGMARSGSGPYPRHGVGATSSASRQGTLGASHGGRQAHPAAPAHRTSHMTETPSADGSLDGALDDLHAHKKRPQPGCLGIIEALSIKLHPSLQHQQAEAAAHTQQQQQRRSRRRGTGGTGDKPDAGVSLTRHDPLKPAADVTMSYEHTDGQHYKIRSLDYMKSKVKVNNACSIYRLAAADMFSFDRKQGHIAKLVNLPAAPPPTHKMGSGDSCFPPLLIINLQLPTYPPSIFGGSDGPGWSIVFYFTLPEDFDPATFPNQKALGLFRRFVQNGKEADGTPTRDRFKIIPRVVNVDEWALKGPLSSAEHKLLSNYNEKPVLSRPQHMYHHGPNYMEIDLDIHTYAYLARTALMSFMTRLASVVWETAFVIQGNSADELPEQVLACSRLYRTNFAVPRPFSSFAPRLSRSPSEAGEPNGEAAPS